MLSNWYPATIQIKNKAFATLLSAATKIDRQVLAGRLRPPGKFGPTGGRGPDAEGVGEALS